MEKCILVQSAFSAALVGWKKFEEKKWMPDSKFFTFFSPKKDLFFHFLDPHGFRAEGPKKFFGPFSKKKLYDLGLRRGHRNFFFGKGPNFFFGPSALKPWGSKNWKKGRFWLKNAKNFEFGIHFFSSKNFQPTNAAEKALFTKKLFFTENWVLKKTCWKK